MKERSADNKTGLLLPNFRCGTDFKLTLLTTRKRNLFYPIDHLYQLRRPKRFSGHASPVRSLFNGESRTIKTFSVHDHKQTIRWHRLEPGRGMLAICLSN
jgi:hypothetical protein